MRSDGLVAVELLEELGPESHGGKNFLMRKHGEPIAEAMCQEFGTDNLITGHGEKKMWKKYKKQVCLRGWLQLSAQMCYLNTLSSLAHRSPRTNPHLLLPR